MPETELPKVTGYARAAGDRIQLQQVILNLLHNATDAMSSIDDRPRELLIRTEMDQDSQIRLRVKDSGAGFALQDADKMFTAFHTTKTDGMGIGLSISRSIIEAHQGTLGFAKRWAGIYVFVFDPLYARGFSRLSS